MTAELFSPRTMVSARATARCSCYSRARSALPARAFAYQRRERESIRTQLTFFRTMAETELPDEQSVRLMARLSALENGVCG